MVALMPQPLDDDALVAAGARRARLTAAIVFKGISQSELHRRLVEAGERELAFTTVNAWCTGRTPLRQLILLGILSVLGLPADWEPEPPSTRSRRPR
jgi:hypothetical protein